MNNVEDKYNEVRLHIANFERHLKTFSTIADDMIDAYNNVSTSFNELTAMLNNEEVKEEQKPNLNTLCASCSKPLFDSSRTLCISCAKSQTNS